MGEENRAHPPFEVLCQVKQNESEVPKTMLGVPMRDHLLLFAFFDIQSIIDTSLGSATFLTDNLRQTADSPKVSSTAIFANVCFRC